MAVPNFIPYTHRPRGVSDTLDDGLSRPGAMRTLTDLIFDPSTPFTFQPRPACTLETAFTGFTTPGVVSAAYSVGTMIYGLVASGLNAGHDQPFAFNTLTGLFVTVSGTVSAATTPATQSSSGDWTPPKMDLMGPILAVTHPGFPGGGGAYFGWFDITTPTSPAWHAGNTTTTALSGVPTSVVQFNNRLWFSIANTVWFTNALSLTITDATQQLTFGSSTPIVAMAPQPLTSATQGGIIQAIMVFKATAIAQITGDAATSNLALNEVSSSTGTSSPRSVVATPYGLAFVSSDGIKLIDNYGALSSADPDLRVPFINALLKSRISAAYNAGIYRVCVQNAAVTGQPYQEYWYDSSQEQWTGPHSFRQDLAIPFLGSFILFNGSLPGKLWQSTVLVDSNTTFTENSVVLSWAYITAPMPDTGGPFENSCILSTVDMSLPGDGSQYACVASDSTTGVLATGIIKAPISGMIWGTSKWGQALWTAISYGLRTFNIPWTNPVVFNKLIIQVTGASTPQLKIGKMIVGYQPLQYINTVV